MGSSENGEPCLLLRWSRRMCFPELLLFALPALSAVVSEKLFNFFRKFDPPFPEKMV
jgi:hypothetical protein